MKDLDSIFVAARELPPANRPGYLAQACGNDPALRARLEEMLAVADRAESFLGDTAIHELPNTEQAGDLIGRYKLLQEIGHGGFGSVWMAEQTEPVTRRVALKIIKLGMDTREVMARFEAERQALAMMDHPNIAKVLDAGATERGRPFFVMELVKGMSITQYCDEAGLGINERLALFGDVCSAINHAHQKGIIHRDIKPSNVMVTMHGDKAVVKVIDFGIAKATQGRLTDLTLFTRFEQFIGTPVYMSPEQASISGLDIDTRSDIYALGILLYELLTGKPPFDAKTLASAGYEEMRRIIREVEPPRPSSRLGSVLGEERTTLAKSRHIDPGKLDRLVEPDLDWIVMKSIDKDRSRRYETANAFAQDILRFLANEPVSARPPSAGYQFRKFAQRNKAALRVAAGIAALLLVATAVSTWLALRAMNAEKLAFDRVAEIEDERDAKEQARQGAESISSFLKEVFQSPDPGRDGREVKVVELLDKAAKKLETDLAGEPAHRARLQTALGMTYYGLGLYPEAIPLLERARDDCLTAFGPEHPETLRVMYDLAWLYFSTDRRKEALAMQEQTLVLSRKVNGPEHHDTLKAMCNLANSWSAAGRTAEALELRQEVLTLRRKVSGPEDPQTLTATHNLALSYMSAGRQEEALQTLETVLPVIRKVEGPKSPATLTAMGNLSMMLAASDRTDEARQMLEEVVAMHRTVSGLEHPHTWNSMLQLASFYSGSGRKAEAAALHEEVVGILRKLRGPDHTETNLALHRLAGAYNHMGRTAEAVPLEEGVLRHLRAAKGPEHADTVAVMNTLASYYGVVGRKDEAAPLREQVRRLTQADFPAVRSTLVAPDSEWKWLHPVDGVDPATQDPDFHSTFCGLTYDDSSWKTGRDSAEPDGGFGYGRAFKGVDIGLPANESHRHAAYFRHSFTTDREHTSLELRCHRDDGIIVYLDGKEVLRDNMPEGPEAYRLAARRAQPPGNDGIIHRYELPGSLPAGNHVLAISVHNLALPSSDLLLGGVTLVETEAAESPRP